MSALNSFCHVFTFINSFAFLDMMLIDAGSTRFSFVVAYLQSFSGPLGWWGVGLMSGFSGQCTHHSKILFKEASLKLPPQEIAQFPNFGLLGTFLFFFGALNSLLLNSGENGQL